MQETIRILLIEDDPADQLLVKRELTKNADAKPQVTLRCARFLQEGLDLLGKRNVDLLLLDLNLPDSDGVWTVTRVRENEPEIPIVVFTVAGDEETAVRALAAGAEDYLVKSEVSGSLLRRAIRYAIERRRLLGEKRQLRSRLVEAEKLESLGVLAAGAAFGLGNLVGEMLERTDRCLQDPELSSGVASEARRNDLLAVRSGALRAARIATQLRDFAAARKPSVGPLDLSEFVVETSPFLDVVAGKAIALDYDLPSDLPPIEGDAIKLRELLTNLVVNAVEAIGEQPGRVEVTTGTLWAERALLADSQGAMDLHEGRLVFLRVRDSGRLIDAASKARLFDPFFTTKRLGRGLGLSAAFGIARQHRGAIHVESTRQEGTVFTVLFPPTRRRPTRRPGRRGQTESRSREERSRP